MKAERQWRYVLFNKEDRPKKFEKVKLEAPEMLRRLQQLPQADGTLDQAQEQVQDFYSVWRPFRVRATKCGQKEWLKTTFYSSAPWRNYETLKKQSSKYKTWKKKDNQRRWAEMPEEEREKRRAKQREASRGDWWHIDRAFVLAKRCLKDDPKATTVQYRPVLRLIRKYATLEVTERAMIEIVILAIACLRYDPHNEESVNHLKRTIHFNCAPGPDQASRHVAERLKRFWEAMAQETYEASDKPRLQAILNGV